jgi:hypothetical protein
MSTKTVRGKGNPYGEMISTCDDMIRTFNSTTHSIDTHISDYLGRKRKRMPEETLNETEQFLQQTVYGWYRQRQGLDKFITNIYADKAASISRTDMTLYTIFAYLAIFRLEDLGFKKFAEFILSQDPTKMVNFTSYLFNDENLWSCLRADWMRVYDLTYVEDDLIAGVERFIPDINALNDKLQGNAQGLAAAEAAKEEAKKNGTAGLGSVQAKELTKPMTPNLTKQRLPKLPEAERLEQNIGTYPMPTNLDRTTLASLADGRRERAEQSRQDTATKYQDPALSFKLAETKAGRGIEDVRREIEEKFESELRFDSSYVNVPPDFSKIPAKVKLNTAAILREDSLFKKQQEKDYNLLKNYEEELRDCTEYYSWQGAMKERDEEVKVKGVLMRRELAKQSAVDARDAMQRQKDNNSEVASMLRQQADEIRKQKEVEHEIRVLSNQERANEIIAIREVAPKEAKEKVLGERMENGRALREALGEGRQRKEEEDGAEEEIRADRIRQQRALNTVHKQHITVFDPTEVQGSGLNSEMSYMEMKERLDMEKARLANAEYEKRKEKKEKKAEDLNGRVELIAKYRKLKADNNREAYKKRNEDEVTARAKVQTKREEEAVVLNADLAQRREEKKKIAMSLAEEEERIKRQQQYLGAAKGIVDETKARQLLEGQERETQARQQAAKEQAIKQGMAKERDIQNRVTTKKHTVGIQRKEEQIKTDEEVIDRREAIGKIKSEIFRKKQMVKKGHKQHETTADVKVTK